MSKGVLLLEIFKKSFCHEFYRRNNDVILVIKYVVKLNLNQLVHYNKIIEKSSDM